MCAMAQVMIFLFSKIINHGLKHALFPTPFKFFRGKVILKLTQKFVIMMILTFML
jgi:hypothetical protein